jgi:beta-glucosidase-like glycosyl hydrolase
MSGRQELLRVATLVDMEKVDLPSFNISMRKFDDVAHAYSKVLLLASIVTLNEADESEDAKKRRAIAVSTIDKLIDNPNAYSYDECSRAERAIVEQAAEDAWGNIPASRRMQDVKQKAKNNLMIKNLKGMVSMLKSALDIYPDVLLDKYMDDAAFSDVLNQLRTKREEIVNATKVSEATCETTPCNDVEPISDFEVEERPKRSGFLTKLFSLFKRH